jgi:alcohol dehydrogenase YqhD (iron-dependent ADH family)
MLNFEYQNPTKIIFGKGTFAKAGEEASKLGKRVLICTGTGAIRRMGLIDRLEKNLKANGLEVFLLEGIQPNPKITSVYEGIDICKKNNVDLILAIGGGSTIDCAKAIATGALCDGDVWEFYASKKDDVTKALPLGTILTLPATGTEMNGNSVVSKWDTKEKLFIYGPAIFPKFSILDPELTFSIPQNHTVYGVVDIIVHVLEQYFTHTLETPMLDRFGEGIILTLIENIYKVLENPSDYDARANIMFCGTMGNSHLIGLGKDQDWASHMIEHELSAIYDISHGAGLAIIYPNWMKYAMKADYGKFAQFAQRVFGVETKNRGEEEIAVEGAEKMREFFNSIGAPSKLAEVGIGEENLALMAERCVRFGVVGGYMQLKEEDVLNILKMSL